jgi:predicted TPR repeat methyltransferase
MPADPTDAEIQLFFERAIELDGPDAVRALYRDWAGVYDATIGRLAAYLSPDRIAAEVAGRWPDRDVPILDLACGTGLVGQALAGRGYLRLTGLDLSQAMLDQARAKGCYDRLIAADLMGPLPVAAGEFPVIVCAGGLTWSHLGPAAFARMVDLLPAGGLIVADVEYHTFEDLGFAGLLDRLLAEGVLARVQAEPAHFFAPGEGEEFHGRYVLGVRGVKTG